MYVISDIMGFVGVYYVFLPFVLYAVFKKPAIFGEKHFFDIVHSIKKAMVIHGRSTSRRFVKKSLIQY
jgi:hypothetical protein